MKKINNMTVFEPTDKCSLDEYSQKAAIEVPELIKKAKEEVNQKVIEISENDIKQDNEITILKTNYTNLQEQNTKLEEKIKKDRDNMINLEVEGQSIHIEDSSDLEGRLEVLGNVEQKTNLYTGKLEQGTINAEGEVSTANRVRTVDFIKVTAGIKIPVRATGADKFAFATYDNNKKFTSIIGTWTNVGESIAIPSNVNYIKIILGKNDDSNIAVSDITNFVVGNLPSPEYPSEIRAVGDNINLFNKDDANVLNAYIGASNGRIAPGTYHRTIYLKVDKGTYTITKHKGIPGFVLGYTKAEPKLEDIVEKFVNVTNKKTETISVENGYIVVNAYVTSDYNANYTVEDILEGLKIEKGEVPTSYSKFGQGSVGIKKQNKNIAPKLKEGKLEKQNTFICNCKKGESFTLSFRGTTTTTDSRLFLRTNTEFTERTDSFIEQEEITLNGTEQKITITSTIDGILYIRTGSGPQIYNFEYLQIEKGKVATEYAEHQEQTKILPIQKPMLEGDCFIKETDSWKEVHNWGKKVFDGTENWDAYKDTQPNAIGFGYNYQDGQKNFVGLSNYFIPYKIDYMPGRLDKDIEGLVIRYNYIKISRFKREIPNVESLKKWLKEIYDLGKPLYVYYKLETPTKLPCTPEQTKILDELDNFQTYKPVTNTTTDSIAKLKLKYIADTKTYIDNKTSNLEQQVSVINQLLSTTRTSSVLLDNLQKDIESEVL